MGEEKALTNADFRKMLMTPRPGAAAPDLSAQAAARKEKKQQRPRPPKPSTKPTSGDEGADDPEAEDGPSYRDRAAERRLGMDPVADSVAPGGTLVGILGGTAPNDLTKLSYDDSKYLGGDMDHTHLVKGLDYALLSKVRSEHVEAEPEEPGVSKPAKENADGAKVAAPRGPVFQTPLGHALHEYLFGRQRTISRLSASERFLPRRTAFIFNMEGSDVSEVPTTLNRAKEDCPRPQVAVNAGIDGVVLERLSKIMAYTSLAAGGSKKRTKKKGSKEDDTAQRDLLQSGGGAGGAKKQGLVERDGETEAPKPVDDDEDIFGDAGRDYEPVKKAEIKIERQEQTTQIATQQAAAPEIPAKRSYFGEGATDLLEDLPPIAQPRPGPSIDGVDAYPDTDEAFAAAEARAAEEKRKAREREAKRLEMLTAQDADDGYAECYPASYVDGGGTIYDSDDNKDDDKGKGADEAEEGEKKKQTGFAARREAMKLEAKEQSKVALELQQIKGFFEEKGYKHDSAFGSKDEEPAAEEKAKKTKEKTKGGDDVFEIAVPTKKRRI